MQRMRMKIQDKVTATPPGTWAKVGVGVLVGGVVVGWLAFPYVLDKVVANQINLAQGRDSRRLWIQLPTFDFNLYAFNITNPAEVMRGAKPVLQEIGPFCYKEVKDKTNFVEDPTSDTISYSARNTWYENQKGPGCPAPQLTGDEVLVVPNVPLLAVLLIAEKDFPVPFMTLVNQALPNIFGRVTDVFMKVTARQLLFDGILVNCTATALYPRAVCIALKQNSRALKKLGDNLYSFSFFGAKNHTPEEFRYTVKRGTKDGQEIGQLVALDGRPELPFWRGDCNKLQGTDSTVFPPFRQMENGSLTAYSSEVCRVIFGVYEKEFDYKGVTGYAYTATFGDTENNPGDRCFCSADDRCRKRGVLDALKCQGAPLVSSQPHFYQASQDYVNGVVGLNPDKEKHEIIIVLEPISGTPLFVRKRLQFNIELKPIRYVPVSQRLQRTLTPLFWAEEALELDGDLMGLLEASLFRPIRAVDVIKWMCVAAGVGLGVAAAIIKFRKNRRDKVHVLNGEAGREFGYEINPNPNHKPEEINESYYPSPFSVGDQEKPIKENGLDMKPSVVNLQKRTSLMAKENELLLVTDPKVSNANVNGMFPKLNQHTSETSHFSSSSQNHIDGMLADKLTRAKVLSPLTPERLLYIERNSDDMLQKTSEDVPPLIKSLTDNSEASATIETLPLSHITSSLEHKIARKSTFPTHSELDFNKPEVNGRQSSLAVDALDCQSSIEIPVETEFDQPKMLRVSENNSIVHPGTVRHPNIASDQSWLFGGSVNEDPNEIQPSFGKENNSFITNGGRIENDVQKSRETGFDETLITAQEAKEVEDDINKLIAEIAELLPNKNFT